jgi:hypothetical protein
MSALRPKVDIVQHSGHVRFVPKADSCTATKKHLASVRENPMHAVRPFAATLVIVDGGRVNQRSWF